MGELINLLLSPRPAVRLHLLFCFSLSLSRYKVVTPLIEGAKESMPGASASSESESSPLASQKMRLRPFSSFLTDPPRHLLDKRLIDPGLYRSLWWALRSLIKLPFFHSHPRVGQSYPSLLLNEFQIARPRNPQFFPLGLGTLMLLPH